jgi:hypothetical protein
MVELLRVARQKGEMNNHNSETSQQEPETEGCSLVPKKSNRWKKIAALAIVVVLVLSAVATSLILMLSGRNSIEGVYFIKDGRTMTVSKGTVTISYPPDYQAPLPQLPPASYLVQQRRGEYGLPSVDSRWALPVENQWCI